MFFDKEEKDGILIIKFNGAMDEGYDPFYVTSEIVKFFDQHNVDDMVLILDFGGITVSNSTVLVGILMVAMTKVIPKNGKIFLCNTSPIHRHLKEAKFEQLFKIYFTLDDAMEEAENTLLLAGQEIKPSNKRGWVKLDKQGYLDAPQGTICVAVYPYPSDICQRVRNVHILNDEPGSVERQSAVKFNIAFMDPDAAIYAMTIDQLIALVNEIIHPLATLAGCGTVG